MDGTIRINCQIANAYYNKGLEKANYRDLSGAVAALKRSIQFDKYQIDARNLLGLIYFEMGEIASALTQWVISLNFKQNNNLAEEYISKLHSSAAFLEKADQIAKKYNQALSYAQNENEDLAVLLLQRMLQEMPNYVKAQQLLALLYMKQENYTKAGSCLYQALKVDGFDPNSLRYMSIVKSHTGRAEVEKKKIKNAFSHRQMQDDDIILPPTYKENTGWQSILNIVVGVLLGGALIFFLVVPTYRMQLNEEHNERLQLELEKINQQNIEIDGLNTQTELAIQEKEEMELQLNQLLEDDGLVSQQQILLNSIYEYLAGNLAQATKLYTDLNGDMFASLGIQHIFEWFQVEVLNNGFPALLEEADQNVEAGEIETAIDYYERLLAINSTDPELLYKIGIAYKRLGNIDVANEYFGQVITDYETSEFAELARAERGY